MQLTDKKHHLDESIIQNLSWLGLSGNDRPTENTGLVEDKILQMIEDARNRFETGFPESEIPPLEPLVLDHLNFDVYQKGVIKADIDLYDITVSGLKSFIVDSITFKIIGLILTFELSVPQIILTALYKVNGKVACVVPFKPKGNAKANAKGVHIKGTAILGTNNGYVNLKSFKMEYDIDEIKVQLSGILGNGKLNSMVNWILTRISADVVKQQKDIISGMASDYVMEIANNALQDMTLTDLISG